VEALSNFNRTLQPAFAVNVPLSNCSASPSTLIGTDSQGRGVGVGAGGVGDGVDDGVGIGVVNIVGAGVEVATDGGHGTGTRIPS